MSVATNFKHPLRNGAVKLARSGDEKFGTVVKSGVNKKTVTVEVSCFAYNNRYRKWYGARRKFHCHDEFEEACVGDKVVIRSCKRLSPRKFTYVKQIILPIGRNAFYAGKFTKDEVDAVDFNENLRNQYKQDLLTL
mmetsp:Transcript_28461/g.25190  ORF Transcript_28461/g.25190 Transcript_28461/m.25190 type:complete len:136 (+) Transcript_28461:12-419(+)